jgi:hypothetical protein
MSDFEIENLEQAFDIIDGDSEQWKFIEQQNGDDSRWYRHALVVIESIDEPDNGLFGFNWAVPLLTENSDYEDVNYFPIEIKPVIAQDIVKTIYEFAD